MEKFITNVINNNYNSLFKALDCTKPQRKNLKKLGTQILKKGTVVLNHLADDKGKNVEDQSEIFGNALEKTDLVQTVNKKIMSRFLKEMKDDTVVAYDLTDEIHKYADPDKQGMEKVRKVLDGSTRSIESGFQMHGVGTDKFLLRMDYHDSDRNYLPQIRREILDELLRNFNGKGIFAFDRGNDDEKLFSFMYDKNGKFLNRLQTNRLLYLPKTNEEFNVGSLPLGRYEVRVKKSGSQYFDLKRKYWVIKYQSPKSSEPITILFPKSMIEFSDKEIVKMYLERWGVENQFRRVKTLYKLESMQVRKWQRRKNITALVLFSHFLTKIIQNKLEQEKSKAESFFFLAWNELKEFLKHVCKTYNDYSFVDFLRTKIPKKLNFFLRVKIDYLTSQTNLTLFDI